MSSIPDIGFRIEFDSHLMEKAVMLGIEGHPREPHYRQAREALYRVVRGEKREQGFERLHRQWFQQIGLDRTVVAALQERPRLLQGTLGCRVIPAPRSKDEGADLLSRPHGFVVLLKLQPGSLPGQQHLLSFLRHEFTHLLDMLDPCFGYEADLSFPGEDPVHDNLIRNRYRVLWDTWIDGRLWRKRWACNEMKQRRLLEFRGTFPMLGEVLEARFSEWFEGTVHTHQEMLEFARQPGADSTDSSTHGRCPLCRFPTYDLQKSGISEEEELVREIGEDFPAWKPSQGVCRQCADLFRSRSMSREAEAALPGERVSRPIQRT
jgi:hypothetical protein